MQTQACVDYCEQLLNASAIEDFCPNGLQVEGKGEIKRLASGVTACQALLDAAVAWEADAVLVHHGYFFKGESPCVVGMKRRRLATLLRAELNLLAYHLPLDVHPELGNNVQLAEVLDFNIEGTFSAGPWQAVGCYGHLDQAQSGETLAEHIATVLGRAPLYVAANTRPIKSIAWVTGAAQDFLVEAHALGVDAFLTGEVSERTYHMARELGVHFFAAGHHATERYGVQALGKHLSEKWGLEHRYFDIDNPV